MNLLEKAFRRTEQEASLQFYLSPNWAALSNPGSEKESERWRWGGEKEVRRERKGKSLPLDKGNHAWCRKGLLDAS